MHHRGHARNRIVMKPIHEASDTAQSLRQTRPVVIRRLTATLFAIQFWKGWMGRCEMDGWVNNRTGTPDCTIACSVPIIGLNPRHRQLKAHKPQCVYGYTMDAHALVSADG